MKNAHNQQTTHFRRNLTVSVALVLFAGLFLSALYDHFAGTKQIEKDTLIMGQQLSKQSEALIRPLVLSSDRISLNYLLNELNQLEHIAGIEVVDATGFVIARSGETSPLKLQTRLQLQEQIIGSTTLWLDSQAIQKQRHNQIWPIAIIALLTILLALLTVWFSCRQMTAISAGQEEDYDQASVSRDEASSNTHSPELKTDTTTEPPIENFSDLLAANLTAGRSASSEIDDEPTEIKTGSPVTMDKDKEEITKETAPKQSADYLQTSSLVDLLKPEQQSSPQMPKFEHHPQDLQPANSEQEPEEQLVIQEEEIIESLSAPEPTTSTRDNPLFKSLEAREEVQLDLYSFEHELELILSPQDAIYIFYIDSQTASSENMHPDERATLLNVYHHLAKQVARIYNGEVELQDNSDILLRFELRDDGDSHGVNAVCAALLFSLLYKGFNQSRIRGFHPVLSLQMSLARGHHDKYNLVKEEAHFLTRTTSSNEVISHTALTEAPKLKEAMLTGADIRREDEDKVLILKVTPKHQTLLQKQANHLLTKIFSKS